MEIWKDVPGYVETGIANISYCANGKRKTAGGYKWKYKE